MTKISYTLADGREVEIEVDDTLGVAELLVTFERQDKSARRKARRHNEASVDAMHERTGWEPRDTSSDTEAAVEAREQQETLRAAVASLSEKRQRLVRLRYYEEKTEDEIAAELGISQQAVSQQLETIHKKLKKYFQ